MSAIQMLCSTLRVTPKLHRAPSPRPINATQSPFSSALGQTRRRSFASGYKRPETTWRTSWKNAYDEQNRRYYGRQAFNYQRFQQTKGLFQRWRASPTFYYQVAGIGGVVGGIYVVNLEEVPVSHRRRFNVVSPATEESTGKQMYAQTMQEFGNKLLPPSNPKVRMVQRVLDRLIPHSGVDADWEVHVIDDPMKNAFVIPGGKVFVFSGILDVCQGEDGLAAVLGHEIAHNVAHHAAERMSQSWILLAIALIGSAFIGVDAGIGNTVLDLAFSRPGSRSQESEADYIGLMMMSESCFDPKAAMGLWARMEEAEQNAPPQFLSTHPSNHNRLEKIRGWLPEAESKSEDSGCSTTGDWAKQFRQKVEMPSTTQWG